ncbi:MAG TPA: enoyl-CoA hydratase/isomerase family protein [Anaerolineales bacterium]|nr:enoyl-CoA hydratase/isomerase family protein [Anaerolineales bacterium]
MSVTLSTLEPGIALLQVKRPEVRNALDWQAMNDFAACVEQAQSMDGLHALVLTGSREAFIAGGDLKALAAYPQAEDGSRLSTLMGNALRQLEALPIATIAAMNGPARGGGAEIALACDLRVVDAGADFGFVQVNLGLTPGWGAGQRLLHLVGYARSIEWLATGRVLRAQEAYDCGLANRISPPGEALAVALELARQIASQPLEAVRAIKRLLRGGLLLPATMAAALEQSEFPPLWASSEHLHAVERFLNRNSSR